MTDRRPKMLRALEANPKAVSPARLSTILEAFGYALARQRGSHRTYTKAGSYPITVPYRRPHVGRVYVEQVIARLRGELELEGDEDDGRD